MKNICKAILALVVCICLALTFASCNTNQNGKNCGGIVKDIECIGEKGDYKTYIQLEITFKDKTDEYYPYLIVIDNYFEFYKCKTINELFKNKDFIDTYSNTTVLDVKDGKAVIEINKIYESNINIYFYESIRSSSELVRLNDLNNYIGYFNYKAPYQESEKLSNWDKGLIKFYGSVVETKKLKVENGEFEKATINSFYKIISLENNFLINVTGKNGYRNGTITCCIAVVVQDSKVSEIKGVAIIDDDNQLFIDKITNDFLNLFVNDYEKNKEFFVEQGYLVVGASKSSNAICNAVNGAVEYINSLF